MPASEWTGMQIDPQTGLLLPEALAKSRAELSERAERQARGKFFSQLGRAERYNQAGAQEKPPDEPSFRYLRDAYFESSIDQLCVARRQSQVRAAARRIESDEDTRIGWTVRHKRHNSPGFKETADIRRRCEEVAQIIDHPTASLFPDGFADFAVFEAEEELVIDRKVMVLFKDRLGRPALYHAIDGSTVKPIVRVLYAWIEEHLGEQANQWGPDMWDLAMESLSYEVGFDLTKAAWVQEIDGVITAAWAKDELSVRQEFPSVEINRVAYGRGSLFQRSLTFTDLWISLIDYNRGLFDIHYPENLLLLFGDYSPAGVEAFTRQLTSQIGNRNWQRLAVVPADPEFKAQVQKLRDTPKDMLWTDLSRLIIAAKCAFYSMHPSEINFGEDREHGALSEPNQEAQMAYAKEEGFDAILHHQSDWLNRAIVWPRYDDLEMVWLNLHRESEEQRIKLATQRVDKYWTIDEARKQENLPPLADGRGALPLPLALQDQQADLQPKLPMNADGSDANGQPRGEPPKPGKTPKLKKSAPIWRPRVPSATTPEGWWRVQIGGRRYLIERTPYGTRYHGPNGALVFHTSDRARNVEEAAEWLEQMIEGAKTR